MNELVDPEKVISLINSLRERLEASLTEKAIFKARITANERFDNLWKHLQALQKWEGHLQLMIGTWAVCKKRNRLTAHSLRKFCDVHQHKSKEELEIMFEKNFDVSQALDPDDKIARYYYAQ